MCHLEPVRAALGKVTMYVVPLPFFEVTQSLPFIFSSICFEITIPVNQIIHTIYQLPNPTPLWLPINGLSSCLKGSNNPCSIKDWLIPMPVSLTSNSTLLSLWTNLAVSLTSPDFVNCKNIRFHRSSGSTLREFVIKLRMTWCKGTWQASTYFPSQSCSSKITLTSWDFGYVSTSCFRVDNKSLMFSGFTWNIRLEDWS